jgi:hypothetical protein
MITVQPRLWVWARAFLGGFGFAFFFSVIATARSIFPPAFLPFNHVRELIRAHSFCMTWETRSLCMIIIIILGVQTESGGKRVGRSIESCKARTEARCTVDFPVRSGDCGAGREMKTK